MSARLSDPAHLRRAASEAGFSVKKFARALGVEVRTLERRFVARFGCSPDEWLSRERMAEAASLLQQGFNTKEVAAEVAYQHTSSFFREFRRRLGCTPSEFVANRRDPFLIPGNRTLSQTATLLSQTATSQSLLRIGDFE